MPNKYTQVIKDVAPEVMECENPVELNCEQVARLREVQENKVWPKVEAIEWSIKFEQKELVRSASSVT